MPTPTPVLYALMRAQGDAPLDDILPDIASVVQLRIHSGRIGTGGHKWTVTVSTESWRATYMANDLRHCLTQAIKALIDITREMEP